MTRMTGPDCVVMCNLINTYIHTYIHTYLGHVQVLLSWSVSPLTMRSQKEVCLGDEIAGLSRMNVFAVERWTPLKVVYLLILCLMYNRRRWFCS